MERAILFFSKKLLMIIMYIKNHFCQVRSKKASMNHCEMAITLILICKVGHAFRLAFKAHIDATASAMHFITASPSLYWYFAFGIGAFSHSIIFHILDKELIFAFAAWVYMVLYIIIVTLHSVQ